MDALAALFENHTRSLPRGDTNADHEREAYDRLVKDQRAVALRLQELAAAKESYRDLPMGGHDVAVLSDTRSLQVFGAFVDAEESALEVLQKQAREYRAMLEAMDAKWRIV